MFGNGWRFPRSTPTQDQLLVGHLMASAPPRSRAANAGSTAISLLAHAVLLALAVWLTTDGTGGSPRPPGFDIELPPDPSPPPPPLPPVIDEPVHRAGIGRAATPDWGILTAPVVMPDSIPLPAPGAITDESFWRGEGTTPGDSEPGAGGTGERKSFDDNPGALVPMSMAPELLNRAEVQRALARLYPPVLRDARMGGEVLVWVLVDENGNAVRTVVKQGSGMPQLDEAALGVATRMRFRPAMKGDVRIKVWVSVPIRFRVDD